MPVPHFGLLLQVEEFQALAGRLRAASTEFVIEPYLRFEGLPGEQWTMFLLDPPATRWSSRPSRTTPRSSQSDPPPE